MRTKIVVGALLAVGLATSARAQIVNPGFETPVLSSGGIQPVPAGTNILPGWTVVGTDVLLVQTNYSEPGNGVNQFNAGEGLNSLDLTGVGNTGTGNGISQLVNTVVNQAYVVQFLVGRASGNSPFYVNPVTVDLSINGGPRVSFTNSNSTPGEVNWQQFTSALFVATGTTTDIAFYNGTVLPTGYAGLDNVRLVAVPEPGPIALAACGLPIVAGLGWLRRRNAK